MSTGLEKIIIQRVCRRLVQFDEMNYHDPMVAMAINAAVVVELSEIQDSNTLFDADANMDYDPEPYVEVYWWIRGSGKQAETLKFRFDPIRVDRTEDPVAAYDRAMSIL